MKKTLPLLGVTLALALGAFAVLAAPGAELQAGDVKAQDVAAAAPRAPANEIAAAPGCRTEEVALDEGYGVSRRARREQCEVTGSVRDE